MVIWVVGIALMLEGVLMLTALPFSLYYHSGDHYPILLAAGITALSGFIMWISTRWNNAVKFGRKDSYLVVTLSWVLMAFFGALPFYFSGYFPKFTDAFFESMSGLTTTGASILTDIEVVPEGILFWRSLTHWIGGMGIIGLSVALMQFIGSGGARLYSAETSDPVKGKIHPRIREALKRLWGIYILLTVAETLLLLAGGMNLFESLCHTFGSVGTGGFSTRNASIGAFSPYIQYVVIVFMILGATNFGLLFYTLSGKFREVRKDQEMKLYFGILIIAGVISGLILYFNSYYDLETSFRYAFFHIASILTTTGYAVDNYAIWPVPIVVLLFLAMFSGGSSGSTTGGLKVVRILIAFKLIILEFKKLVAPNAVIPVRLNGQVLQEGVARNALVFILLYIGSYIIMTIMVAGAGSDFTTSASAVAACIGSIGPGLGEVGPVGNYSMIPDFSKWVLSFAMLIGRLELFSVLLLFVPAFWKN
jgi:trk system potassium uptake protein